MRRRTLALVPAGLAIALGLGCQRPDGESSTAPRAAPPPLPPDAAPPPEALGPEGPWEGATTPADAWERGLVTRRQTLEARIEARPDDVDALAELAQVRAELAWLDGDADHLAVAEHLLNQASLWRPGDPAIVTLRDHVLERLHRFGPRAVELEQRHLADPDDATARTRVAWAIWDLGQYRRAKKLLDKPGEPVLDARDLVRAARHAFERGDAEEADRLLRRAHAQTKGPEPGPRVAIDLERARIRLHTGRYAEARRFLEAAHRRLPRHVAVTEMLARAEALLGDTDAALARYTRLAERTGLPSALTGRARLLRVRGDADAKAALEAADQAWRAQLERHPSIFIDGALRFWLDDRPDPKAAEKWARRRLELRRDVHGLLLAARAHVLADHAAWAADLIAEARRAPVRTDRYFTDLAAALAAVGKVEEARAAFAKARELNPKVAPPAGLAP